MYPYCLWFYRYLESKSFQKGPYPNINSGDVCGWFLTSFLCFTMCMDSFYSKKNKSLVCFFLILEKQCSLTWERNFSILVTQLKISHITFEFMDLIVKGYQKPDQGLSDTFCWFLLALILASWQPESEFSLWKMKLLGKTQVDYFFSQCSLLLMK